jgi:hypothetical protein
MAKLMYNNMTDDLIAREKLADLPIPAAMGQYHNPYPFSKFVDMVDQALEARGCRVINEEYAVTKDGARLFGLMEVTSADVAVPDDWRLLLGLRGAHDQAFSRALTLGSRVIVCSNLCFHGDVGVWKTRQTSNIDKRLPALIDDAVSRIPSMASELVVEFDAYRGKVLDRDDGHRALVDLFRADAFSSAQLGRAITEWNEPSHAEHGEDGFTAWRLLNAATQALKPTGTSGDFVTLQRRSEKVHGYLSRMVH